MRIFLLDPTPDEFDCLKMVLEQAGHEVDGLGRPAVVVFDVGPPPEAHQMDRWRAVVDHYKESGACFLVLTTNPKLPLRDIPGTMMLVKPYHLPEVFECLGRFAAQQREGNGDQCLHG